MLLHELVTTGVSPKRQRWLSKVKSPKFKKSLYKMSRKKKSQFIKQIQGGEPALKRAAIVLGI